MDHSSIQSGKNPSPENAIAAAPRSPALEPDMLGLPKARHEHTAAWAGMLLITHALIGAFLIYLMLGVVPSVKRAFVDFQMKLPWLAEFAIAISDWMLDFSFLLPFVFGIMLVGDGAVLYLLRRNRWTRELAWLWFFLILILLLFTLAVLIWAMLGPFLALMQGLSR